MINLCIICISLIASKQIKGIFSHFFKNEKKNA